MICHLRLCFQALTLIAPPENVFTPHFPFLFCRGAMELQAGDCSYLKFACKSPVWKSCK